MEFVCDLTYNITMSRIHASVQGLVFQAVLRQDITFFDENKPGKKTLESFIHSARHLFHSDRAVWNFRKNGDFVSLR